MSKSYGRSKICAPLPIQISIVFSCKHQILIEIAFWKALKMKNTPSKSQSKLRTTEKVIASQTSASQWIASGFLQISKLYNFCFVTPDSNFETNLESSLYKDQTHKFSIEHEQCSMGYT